MTESCETLRLKELARINPATTASEANFDLITRLVQQILNVPAVAITLIDHDTQYLRARQGVDLETTPRGDAVCDIVVRSGKPLIIEDMHKDARVADNPAVTGPMGLRAYAGAPVTTKAGFHLGSLCALDTKPRVFSPEQIDILRSFALLVSDLLELRAQVDHDYLTGILNRRGFEAMLEREISRINRNGSAATLALMDLDHFKSVNDTYGHPVGDKVLKALADLLSTRLRKSDYLARIGGEEFAVLLPDTALERAAKVVNRMRTSVAQFRMEDYPDLSLTISIGLVDITRYDQDSAAMMREVDAAVYLAKSKGRNQTRSIPTGPSL